MNRPIATALLLLCGTAFAGEPLPAYRHRVLDKQVMLESGGGDAATEEAVKQGLLWLARHQSRGGGWHPERFAGDCGCGGTGDADHATGVTGLALLAFAGAGYGPGSEVEWEDPVTGEVVKLGAVVRRGLASLAKQQRQDGRFDGGGAHLMYSHAMAVAAMCEHYGLSQEEEWKRSAEAGVDYLLAARNQGAAWRYTSRSGENDTSVTAWCVQALHAARMSEIGDRVAIGAAMTGARAWVRSVTDPKWYTVGYLARGDGKVVVPGKNDEFENHHTMVGAGMLIRLRAGEVRETKPIVLGAKLLVSDLPIAFGRKIDAMYWYYFSQGLYLCKGPRSKYWTRGPGGALRAALTGSQEGGEGCTRGSWDSDVDRWGFAGGRVAVTALNILSLEIPYRHKPSEGVEEEGGLPEPGGPRPGEDD